MIKNILILIPPSEGKKPGGKEKPIAKASPEVQVMIERLWNYDGDFEKLLGVKGKKLEDSLKSNKTILTSGTMRAIERYTGVVYNGIGYPSFDEQTRLFFNNHVRIISAVFGLVKPDEFIPDYKLKIEKLGAAKYWQPIISRILDGMFIIDLLPQAHKKAVSYVNGAAIEFVIEKNGKKIPAGHNGKFIKGRFIRWLCKNQISDTKNFPEFSEDGFRWTGEFFLRKK